MTAHSSTADACGGGGCQCGTPSTPPTQLAPASINGVALHAPGQTPDAATLRERAYTELLRQQACALGLLPDHTNAVAPELDDAQRRVIEDMLDQAVTTPQPTEDECQRYYAAHTSEFVVGQALQVRHILFAVTPGVNVQALSVHAEKALLSLLGQDVPPGRFAQLAAELSNCPSSAQGGDLGWIGPDDCAPELANELFHQKHLQWSVGVHPRLVHTRFGFHILEVLDRRAGQQLSYDEVHERIAGQLTLQSRARALHQYMSLLVGQAQVEGLDLEGADTPLVQ